MGISDLQFFQKELDKFKFEKMSEISLDNLLNYEEMYSELTDLLIDVYDWKVKVNKHGKKVVSRLIDEYLNETECNEICKNHHKKSIDLIIGIFQYSYYSNACLKILDLLSDNGVAFLCVPSINYKSIDKEVQKMSGLYINAIFSSDDQRKLDDSINKLDKKYTLPVNCKYLALFISRQSTENLFIFTEYSNTSSVYNNWDEWVLDYKNFLDGKLSLTKQNMIYKDILSNKRVIIKKSYFSDIVNFYNKSKMHALSHRFFEFEQEKLSNIVLDFQLNNLDLIVHFLKCCEKDSVFNTEKWRSYLNTLEENSKIFDDPEIDPTSEDFISKISERIITESSIKEYIPEPHIKDLEGFFIIESYSSKYGEQKHVVYHPYEWRIGEYKFWMWDDKLLTFSLIWLDSNKLIGTYFLEFMRTEFGKISSEKSLIESSNISDAWMNIEVPLPDLKNQKIIASAIKKSTRLHHDISSLKEAVINNPKKAKEIDTQLTDWIKKLDKLSLDEKIIDLIKAGESDLVEFKETLSLDIKKQTKEKYIEHSSLKTITGFLNNKGGILLVGVSDNGSYSGILEEVDKFHKANFDKFLLHFKNLIKRSIGEEFYPYVEYQLVDVNESKVLYVNCGKSKKPCYLDGKDFYVRTNPATEKLEGPELVNYIQNHFET